MISIVVPTYNEKDNIIPLLERIHAALHTLPHEVIFVDDSTDETPQVIADVAKRDPSIVLRHREEEKGLATAVVLGFALARGDYVACMDADLQHPPEVLLDMVAAMHAGADIVIPSRFIPGGSDGGLDFVRGFISGMARYMGKLLLPCLRHISDPTSGLFMVRRALLQGAQLSPVGWKIMVEVLAMCPIRRVIETPYAFCDRERGESKLSAEVSLQYIRQLKELRRRAANQGRGMQVLRWSTGELTDRKAALNADAFSAAAKA